MSRDNNPCTCCRKGVHIINSVAAGRDHLTCKCSRKKCYICMKCIIHCGCKERIIELETVIKDAINAATQRQTTSATMEVYYQPIIRLERVEAWRTVLESPAASSPKPMDEGEN